MPKIHKIKLLPILVIIALIAGSVGLSNVNAAAVGVIETLTDQTTNASSTYTTKFYAGSTNSTDGHTIILTFSSGLSLTNVIPTLFTVGATNHITTMNATASTCNTTTDTYSWAIASNALTLTECTIVASTITAGDLITITVAGINGATAQNETVVLSGTLGDTGTATTPLIDPAQITVTAVVDPTISLSLSNTVCNLQPALNISTVGTCTYNVTTATNAVSGLTVKAVGSDSGTLVRVGSADAINACATDCSVGVNDVTAGTEEYGFKITTVGGNHTATGSYATNYQPLPSTAASIFTASGAHTSTSSTITHAASVDGLTPAGSYIATTTWTAVGTF